MTKKCFIITIIKIIYRKPTVDLLSVLNIKYLEVIKFLS